MIAYYGVQAKEGVQTSATDPRVLDCLAAFLTRNHPETAHAFHLTCRHAATAIKSALEKLTITAKHADLAAVTYNFPAVNQLRLHQCVVDAQARFQRLQQSMIA